MSILGWLIIGGLAGWVASMFTGTDARMGLFANIIAGIIGAFVGGFIVGALGGTGFTGFNIWSFIVATFGAIITISAFKALAR